MKEARPGLAKLKKDLLNGDGKGRTRKRKRKVPKRNDMMLLDTSMRCDKLSSDNIGEYINIGDTSLDREAKIPLELVFGRVICIQRALDYVTHPNMLPEHLTKPTLSKETINYLKTKTVSLDNYWAVVGYCVIERIFQDDKLRKELLEDKPIVNVVVSSKKTFKGYTKVITPRNTDAMYLGVVRAIVDTLRNNKDEPDEVIRESMDETLEKLKRDSSKSIFAGSHIKTTEL